MVDAFRAQLDALMGVNRNGDVVRARDALCDAPVWLVKSAVQGGTKLEYRDKSVCRYYLEGLCPCELFVNTVRSSAASEEHPGAWFDCQP